jgi:hypothetical protein
MSEYKRQPNGHECPPPPKNPADQPRPPGGTCEDLPTSTVPPLKPPEPCPPPDSACQCPKGPASTANCLEDMIAKQAAEIAAAEKAKVFKADLEALLGKARTAAQEYTRDKYDKLVKQWVEEDIALAELVRKLVCAVPCWRCVIDCHVCPLLNALHEADAWLYGDGDLYGTLYTEVHNLYDQQYWLTRDLEAKTTRLSRIQAVLGVWDKPSQAIEKILNDNKSAIEAAGKALGSAAGRVVFDVFVKIGPLHLAIAPPADSGYTTGIAKEYTEFCTDCDKGDPDNCCGPDVGRLSFRRQLIGPRPYLIDPNDYFKLICCLVENRYSPAKDAVAKAEAELAAVNSKIARYKAQVPNGMKGDQFLTAFEKDALASIPSVIDCCDYEHEEPEPESKQSYSR